MAHPSLDDPAARAAVIARIAKIAPDSPRQWGKMSAHQMLCHLTDSYRAAIGERAVSPVRFPIPRPILKWLVLRAPLKWGKNAPTRPEVEQGKGGTPPADFEADRRALLQSIDRFCSAAEADRSPHPMMGTLDREEWMRWGYLHADHHLRQFGL